MRQSLTDIFFALLRAALGAGQGALAGQGAPADHNAPAEQFAGRFAERPPFVEPLSGDDWKQIFSLSKKQALLGVIYGGIKRLPAELQPPADLMQQWTLVARRIMATNNRMNATAASITRMFAERGRKTVILKGQANALLYPDPYLRQAGDIDILVEGGRKSVLKLLREMGLMEGVSIDEISNLHIHLDSGKFAAPITPGITVEIHFDPSYNNSPFTTRAMCRFLEQENSKPGAVKLSEQGFSVPPVTFALVMQLSHLLRHFYGEGIGLRQLADYSLLLRNSTEQERALVRANLRKVGLYHMAGAVMYVMGSIFHVPESQMLCSPDARRGRQLMENVMEGGNFGKYSEVQNLPVFRRWLNDRMRPFRRFAFDIPEALWHEWRYVVNFTRYIPKRIKYRKISVRKV